MSFFVFLSVLNNVINIISVSGTTLFILYKYSNFLSYFIGFMKFCNKLYISGKMICNNVYTISYKKNIEETPLLYTNKEGGFTGMIKRTKGWVLSFFKKKEYNILPVYQTRESYTEYINQDNINQERVLFQQQIDNLIDTESNISSSTNSQNILPYDDFINNQRFGNSISSIEKNMNYNSVNNSIKPQVYVQNYYNNISPDASYHDTFTGLGYSLNSTQLNSSNYNYSKYKDYNFEYKDYKSNNFDYIPQESCAKLDLIKKNEFESVELNNS